MVPIHLFCVVQLQRTSSNLLKPLQCRESNVCRGLSREFGVVRPYRTFSNHIFTSGSRCVWYLYTCSGWFNCSEPPPTISNHFSAEKVMHVQVTWISLGWVCGSKRFGIVEPLRTHVVDLYTPCFLCIEAVHKGSRRFAAVKPPGTSV